MSEDRRINVRGAFYEVLERAAARRHVSVAALTTVIVTEYLLKHGELAPPAPASAPTPNTVSPADELVVIGHDADGPRYGTAAKRDKMQPPVDASRQAILDEWDSIPG